MSENSPNVTAEDNQEKSLGAFKASTALSELFETASPHLSRKQLELIARATEQAKLEAENMSSMTEYLGLLISEDANDEWDLKSQCPQLFWQISNQFDYIAALIEMGASAKYRLEHSEQFDVNEAAFEAALREVRRIEAEKENEQSNKPQEPLQ
jgi:hypothetical protein